MDETELLNKIREHPVPRHLAIIMDGNGRWAQEKGLLRQEGHLQGVETVRETVKNCNELGIKYLTLFAFSTENWKRPPAEVNFLMSLPEIYFKKELPELMRNQVQVKMIGDFDRLPAKVQQAVQEGAEATKNNRSMHLIFALNYGGRAEILRAVNQIVMQSKKRHSFAKISEKEFAANLYTKDLPDPDLLIRTSGEMRISNFLLWQLAYSELWFTEAYWPDFSKKHLLEAVFAYQNRKRRFGSL